MHPYGIYNHQYETVTHEHIEMHLPFYNLFIRLAPSFVRSQNGLLISKKFAECDRSVFRCMQSLNNLDVLDQVPNIQKYITRVKELTAEQELISTKLNQACDNSQVC